MLVLPIGFELMTYRSADASLEQCPTPLNQSTIIPYIAQSIFIILYAYTLDSESQAAHFIQDSG